MVVFSLVVKDCFSLVVKDCIFLNVIIPFSTSHLQQFPSTRLIPENCSSTVIFQRKVPPLYTWRVHKCKLYICRCDPPFSSNQPRIGAVLFGFLTPPIFPALMLNQWCTWSRANGDLSIAGGPDSNTIHFPYEPTTCQNLAALHLIVCTQ